MSQKTIAVDLDDVLASSAQGFVDFSNKQWGTNLSVDDYREHWGNMWQVDDAEYHKRAQIVYKSGAVRDFVAHEDARTALGVLSQKYELVIATSRVKAIEKDTKVWLDTHYRGIFKAVHLGGFYDTISHESHSLTKAELCQRIGADYLIDDQPKHCLAVAEAGMTALLFGDYPWNRETAIRQGVTRVFSWREVLAFFDGKN